MFERMVRARETKEIQSEVTKVQRIKYAELKKGFLHGHELSIDFKGEMVACYVLDIVVSCQRGSFGRGLDPTPQQVRCGHCVAQFDSAVQPKDAKMAQKYTQKCCFCSFLQLLW